jgi:hypothetical protein
LDPTPLLEQEQVYNLKRLFSFTPSFQIEGMTESMINDRESMITGRELTAESMINSGIHD